MARKTSFSQACDDTPPECAIPAGPEHHVRRTLRLQKLQVGRDSYEPLSSDRPRWDHP